MLQLLNKTPFAAKMALLPNEEGVDSLYINLKATFNIAKDWTLVDEQTLPVEADEYWGEPAQSSIRYGSDFHLGKLASDIILSGHACAPGQKPVRQLDVELSVGQVKKSVRVFGDRQWQQGQATQPEPFTMMPMIYEKAFGGKHIEEKQFISSDVRNPVGCGYVGKRKVEEIEGLKLPNLEDPAQLIRSPQDSPVPACFGCVAPHWEPRASLAGTYDEQWETQRAPYLPDDFDKRFFNVAHSDLIYPGYLQGGENVTITNMRAEGNLNFKLPLIKPVLKIVSGGLHKTPGFNLETLLIEPDHMQLSMLWKASMTCDKKQFEIGEVQIGLSR